jgi:formate dehydrogenase major subunit
VVPDIFFTGTAVLADVVLPASARFEKWGSYTNTDRLVQIGRPVLAPPGDARQDLWAIHQIATRVGLPWRYRTDTDWHERTQPAMLPSRIRRREPSRRARA